MITKAWDAFLAMLSQCIFAASLVITVCPTDNDTLRFPKNTLSGCHHSLPQPSSFARCSHDATQMLFITTTVDEICPILSAPLHPFDINFMLFQQTCIFTHSKSVATCLVNASQPIRSSIQLSACRLLPVFLFLALCLKPSTLLIVVTSSLLDLAFMPKLVSCRLFSISSQ